jgi:hypothetical protein
MEALANEPVCENWMIEGVGVGTYDRDYPIIWFTVTDGQGLAALQWFKLDSPEAKELLGSVYESKNLNGRMCRVKRYNGVTLFDKLLPAARR